jgi:hypothetical protein
MGEGRDEGLKLSSEESLFRRTLTLTLSQRERGGTGLLSSDVFFEIMKES